MTLGEVVDRLNALGLSATIMGDKNCAIESVASLADAASRGKQYLSPPVHRAEGRRRVLSAVEMLSDLLTRRGIKHVVLNAKYHKKESAIVAQAGAATAGDVVYFTNPTTAVKM